MGLRSQGFDSELSAQVGTHDLKMSCFPSTSSVESISHQMSFLEENEVFLLEQVLDVAQFLVPYPTACHVLPKFFESTRTRRIQGCPNHSESSWRLSSFICCIT